MSRQVLTRLSLVLAAALFNVVIDVWSVSGAFLVVYTACRFELERRLS